MFCIYISYIRYKEALKHLSNSLFVNSLQPNLTFRQMKLLYMRSIKGLRGVLSDDSAVFILDHPDLIELSRRATQGAIRPLSLPRKFQTPFPARSDSYSRYRIRHQKNWSWRKLGSLISEPEKLPRYSQ